METRNKKTHVAVFVGIFGDFVSRLIFFEWHTTDQQVRKAMGARGYTLPHCLCLCLWLWLWVPNGSGWLMALVG